MQLGERVVGEKVVACVPTGQDAIICYKIRYTRLYDEDGAYESRSYYGGLGGDWHLFEGFDVLDLSMSGVLALDGMTVPALLHAIAETDTTNHHAISALQKIRDEIDEVIQL